MIENGEGEIDWIWKLLNKAFEKVKVPTNWRRTVIIPIYIGVMDIKETMGIIEELVYCFVWKICASFLVESVR